jgi:hypothetical protein
MQTVKLKTPLALTKGQPMPTHRIGTIEHWPRRVTYELAATDMKAAISVVEHHQAEPIEDEHIENESDQIVEFMVIELIDDEPAAPAAFECRPNYQAKRRAQAVLDAAAPEIKQYTVLLLVPPDIQRKAGELDTFLGHVNGVTIPAAIKEAKELAACELDCDDLAEHFTPLLVLEGWHDEILFPKE